MLRVAILLDNKNHSIDYMITDEKYNIKLQPRMDKLTALEKGKENIDDNGKKEIDRKLKEIFQIIEKNSDSDVKIEYKTAKLQLRRHNGRTEYIDKQLNKLIEERCYQSEKLQSVLKSEDLKHFKIVLDKLGYKSKPAYIVQLWMLATHCTHGKLEGVTKRVWRAKHSSNQNGKLTKIENDEWDQFRKQIFD